MASEAPSSELENPPSGMSTEMPQAPAPPPPQKKLPPRQTITESIKKGKVLRVQKSSMPKNVAKSPPSPAYPKGLVPTARDVTMSRRQTLRQSRCLRTYNIVLSDRMDELAKPTRRQLINIWRTYADILTPEQIHNLQTLLDATDPFKPEEAYEFFVNLRKQKKKSDYKENKSGSGKKSTKKDLSALCGDRQFAWARSATVAFARGIMRRLGSPTQFQLEDSLLRLSNIVLAEICAYSKMRVPSRRCHHAKSRFMVDMADKIAVWMDEILQEADERMIMMDFDEDEEVENEQVSQAGSSVEFGAVSTPASVATPPEASAPASTGSATPDAQDATAA